MFFIAIILWIVMLVAAVLAIFAASSNSRSDRGLSRGGWIGVAILAGVLGFGAFAWAGVKSVPAKSIGVPVSLGHVGTGFYGSGAHETWNPFLHLAVIDETVQTTTFEAGAANPLPGTKACDGALPVRIGGQQQACADITIQWQVKPGAATTLFSDYANQGDLMTVIENAVVIRELKLVANQEVGDYDPITDYQTTTGQSVAGQNTATSQFTAFGPAMLKTMQADIGSQITVRTVLFPYMHYSAAVETKLQNIQQAYANFAIAQENVQVNHENSLAFGKLGNPTENQLIAQCLNDVRENHQSPMGCFPGQSSGLQISNK